MKVLGEIGFDQTVTEIKKLRSKVSELQQIIDNSEIGMGYIDCTYAEALELANNAQLNAGYRYRINDYEPCVRESKLYKYMPSNNVKKIYIFLTALSGTEFDLNCTIQLETKNQGIVEVNGQYSFDNQISTAAIDAIEYTWTNPKKHKGTITRIDTQVGTMPYDFYNIGIRNFLELKPYDTGWNYESKNSFIRNIDGKYYAMGYKDGTWGHHKSKFDLTIINLHDYKFFAEDGTVYATQDVVMDNVPANVVVGDNISEYFIGPVIGRGTLAGDDGSYYVENKKIAKIRINSNVSTGLLKISDISTILPGTELTTLMSIDDVGYILPETPNIFVTPFGDLQLREQKNPGEGISLYDVTNWHDIKSIDCSIYYSTYGSNINKTRKLDHGTTPDKKDYWYVKYSNAEGYIFFEGVWYSGVDFDNKQELVDVQLKSLFICFLSNGDIPTLREPKKFTFTYVNTIVESIVPSTGTPNPYLLNMETDYQKIDSRLQYGLSVPYADASAGTIGSYTSSSTADEFGHILGIKYDLYLPRIINGHETFWTSCSNELRDLFGLDLKTNKTYFPKSERCEVKLHNGNTVQAYQALFAIKLLDWMGAENVVDLKLFGFDYGDLVVDNIETIDNIHANISRDTQWNVEIRMEPVKDLHSSSVIKGFYSNYVGKRLTINEVMRDDTTSDVYHALLQLSIICTDINHPDRKPIEFVTDVKFDLWRPNRY